MASKKMEKAWINMVAETELEALQKDKVLKIRNIGLYVKNNAALVDALKEEEKKLRERRQRAEAKIDWLKKYLTVHMEGEKLETPTLRICWRKSKSIETNEDFDILRFANDNPTYVKSVFTLRKKELKDLMEETGLSFKGIELKEKQNIIIK
jgi:hypothetical protein